MKPGLNPDQLAAMVRYHTSLSELFRQNRENHMADEFLAIAKQYQAELDRLNNTKPEN